MEMVPGSFGRELNPSTDNGLGAKVAFDCTCPVPKAPKFEKVDFMNVDLQHYASNSGKFFPSVAQPIGSAFTALWLVIKKWASKPRPLY